MSLLGWAVIVAAVVLLVLPGRNGAGAVASVGTSLTGTLRGGAS